MARTDAALQMLVQALAIAGLVLIWAMILHKGYTDISLIADRHSGAGFRLEVARYLIGNLAGGKPPAVNS